MRPGVFILCLLIFFIQPVKAQDKGEKDLRKAEARLEAAKKENNPAEIANTLFKLGRIYRMQLQDYPAARDQFLAAISAFQAVNDSIMLGESYRNLAAVYNKMGELPTALEAGKTAIRILENTSSLEYLNWSYNTIGIVYKNMGDYERALNYYSKYLSYSLKSGSLSDAAYAYNNIGTCYDEMYELEVASEIYQKCLDIFQQLGDQDGIGTALLNLGRIDNKLGRHDHALEKFFQALEINRGAQDYHGMLVNYKNIAGVFFAKKDYQQARIYYQKAADLARRLKVRKLEESSLREISYLVLLENQYDKALDIIQKALEVGLGKKLPQNPLNNLSIDEIPVDHEIIPSFEQKARVLLQRHLHQSHQKQDLEAALRCYRLTLALIDKLRYQMDAKSSKLQLAANNLSVYENAIVTANLMFEWTDDPAFIEEAFLIAEKNKGILLYEKFLEHQARIASPSQYHRIKSQTDPVSLAEIREALLSTEKKYLVEYFIGTQRVYAFKLSENDLEIIELDSRSVLDSMVRALRTSISDPWEAEIQCASRSTVNYSGCKNLDSLKITGQENYIRYATGLYQRLIEPLENKNIPMGQNLILIPDAFLAMVPFDALLTTRPLNPEHYRDHPYLLKRYQLSYGPSASLLAALAAPIAVQKVERPLLVMAPFVKNDSRHKKLTHSQQEAETLYKNWGGTLLLGDRAGMAAFHQYAPGSKILHISSHAFGKTEQGVKTRIALADQDLLLEDIYPLQLQAKMVMLSACETAMGPLSEGEGILSLGHAFFHAGSQSVFTTLWKVQDKATSELVGDFYEDLSKGYSKDKALHQAQLTYLKNHDHRLSHPYFWAGWFPAGDMSPLVSVNSATGRNPFTLSFLLLLLAGVGFWAFSFFRKKY